MSSGRFFRLDQKQANRVQNAQARRQLAAARAEQEAARLRRGNGPGDRERRAREEAAERDRRAREEAELRERQAREEAERLRRQKILEATAERNLRRQQQAQAIAARDSRQQAALQARQQAIQRDNQETRVYEAMVEIVCGLPPLRLRCINVLRRTESLARFLAGSGIAEEATASADVNDLTAIGARCQLNLQTISSEQVVVKTMNSTTAQNWALVNSARILQLLVQMNQDIGDVTQADQRTTAGLAGQQLTIQLANTYPNLSLTLAVILNPLGPTSQLLPEELDYLNGKLERHPVQTWGLGRLPATRTYRSGFQLLIPIALKYFPYEVSSEVFHDWIWEEKVGHGQPAARMCEILRPINAGGGILGTPFDWRSSGGKWEVTHPNVILKIVLDASKTLLITFYKKP